jgi:hypothetical protein
MPAPSKKHYQELLERLVQPGNFPEELNMGRYLTAVSPNDLPNILSFRKDLYKDSFRLDSDIRTAIEYGPHDIRKTL